MTAGPFALLHDIGHEVATLSALVAAVRGEDGLDADARERMALVARQIDRLADLLTDWDLPSDAVEAGDEVLELRDVLHEVVVLRDAASPGSVVLHPGPAVLVRVDRQALCRLVTNLVDNAVRAAGAGGVVELDLDAEGGADPVVRVADDGPGPGAGPRGDRGMGLAIVRTLARRLGAEVTVRPRRGGGTVAEVVLRGRRAVPVPAPRAPGCGRPDDASAPPPSGQVARGPDAPG